MFVYAERLTGRNVDCARDIHGGTYTPAVAEVLVDGTPLCLRHFITGLPAAPEVLA